MRRAVLFGAALLVACGGDPSPADGGTTDGAGRVCRDDAECDDRQFCTGVEVCAPDDPAAGADGCVAGAAPCAGSVCDEGAGECVEDCAEADADGDGHDRLACGGDDCDDDDADRFPGHPEVCDDAGHDEDCLPDTLGDRDADGDGFASSACCNEDPAGAMRCGEDCNDGRRDVRPGNSEACDGLDNDCDGAVDEGVAVTGFADLDFDLHGDPDAPRSACADTPGFSTVGDDCDDAAPTRHGAQIELCDAVDNDCDGAVDEDTRDAVWFGDGDGDGFGDVDSGTRTQCAAPDGFVLRANDCDDGDAAVNAAAPELCNGRDDDCSGWADFEIAAGDFEDDDLDGYADATCGGDDCDDTRPDVYPGAIELCDGVDNDCDGAADGVTADAVWYLDIDRDGFGDAVAGTITSCEPQPGRVSRGGDCDDTQAAVHPGVADPCDGIDQDCDGRIDESGVRRQFYADADGDGWGSPSAPTLACARPPQHSERRGDCDDDDRGSYPGQPEVCDGADNDCDDTVDEDARRLYWTDADEDGYGDPGIAPTDLCMPSASQADNDDDCDDADPAARPGASERCNGADDDCDGDMDEGADAACVFPGSTGVCEAGGVCSPGVCVGAYLDCDLDPQNGCEIDGGVDPAHCGACGATCGLADTCSGGTCDLSPPIAIHVGGRTVIAERATGGLVGWGRNVYDTLRVGSTSDVLSPVDLGVGGYHSLGVGPTHICAVTDARLVVCWGRGIAGQLGDGEQESRADPVAVVGLTDVVSVGAGNDYSCALRAGGDVWCWGTNSGGRLGSVALGTSGSSLTPVRVDGIDDAVQLAVAYEHACVLRPRPGGGREVWCWGENGSGQLGQPGSTDDRAAAQVVADLPPNVVALGEPSYRHLCVRTDAGEVWCFGRAGLWLGAGSTAPSGVYPVVGITNARDVVAGDTHSCARVATAAGTEVRCWGSNTSGSLGDGTITARPEPVAPSGGPTDVVAIDAADSVTCAVRATGEVLCWGENVSGALGQGTTIDSSVPIAVPGLP